MNIYCTKCGSKHSIGSKFCSSCGNSLTGEAAPQNRRPTSQARQSDDDDIPDEVIIPERLSYTVEKPISNRFTVAEALSRPPMEAGKNIKIDGYKKPSLKEFGDQSMKECGKRPIEEINE